MPIRLTNFGRSILDEAPAKTGALSLTPEGQSLLKAAPADPAESLPIPTPTANPRDALNSTQNFLTNPIVDKMINVFSGGMSLKESEQNAKSQIKSASDTIKTFQGLTPKAFSKPSTNLMDFFTPNKMPSSDQALEAGGNALNFIFGPEIKTARALGGLVVPEKGKSPLQSAVKDVVKDPGPGVYAERIGEHAFDGTENDALRLAKILGVGAAGTALELGSFNPSGIVKGAEHLIANSKVMKMKSVLAEVEKDLPKIKEVLAEQRPDLPQNVIDNLTATSIVQGAETNPTLGSYLKAKIKRVNERGSVPIGKEPTGDELSKSIEPDSIQPLVAPSAEAVKALTPTGITLNQPPKGVESIGKIPLAQDITSSIVPKQPQPDLNQNMDTNKPIPVGSSAPPVKPPILPPVAAATPAPGGDRSDENKPIESTPQDQQAGDRAQMELEILHHTGGVHPLELAMKEIGGVKFSDFEEKIPRRFSGSKPADEARQELANNYGIEFANDSEFHQALKSLGDKQNQYRLSPETQTYLKNQKNVEALGRRLEKKIPSSQYKKIIYSNVGLKSSQTSFLTSREKMLKYQLASEARGGKFGEKQGVRIERVRQLHVSSDKITALKRKAELQRLKDNIIARDKESARRGRIVAEYDAEIAAIERKWENKQLKTDIIHRYKIKDIKEMAEKKEVDVKEIRGALVDYVRENLPPEARFKLLPEIRDVETNANLIRAVLKVEKIKDEIDAKNKAIEDAKRFTPAQRKELYQKAYSKGLIVKLENGKTKDKLHGLLRYYKDASFDELKSYINELQGAEGNPPLILKLFGDANADADAVKLVNEASADWRDINEMEVRTLDMPRIIEKVTGLDLWDSNILAENFFDVIAGADASRFDRFNSELSELSKNSEGILKDTKASANLMKKYEAGETLTASEQKVVDFLRSKYNMLIKEANDVRAKLGKKPIPYRANYMTHIRDQNLLVSFFKGDIAKTQEISNEQLDAIRKGDFTKGNMKFNKFAQKRLGEKTKYDAIGNYEKYLETLLYEIYMTPAVTHARRFTDYALLRLPHAYEATTALLNELAGKPSSLDKLMKPIVSNQVVKWFRSQIAKNALIGNINFNLVNLANLSTSIGELGQYTFKGAAGFLGNRDLRELAFKHSSVLRSRQSQFDADVKAISVFNPASFDKLTVIEKGKVAGRQLQYLIEGLTRIIEYNNVGGTWVGAYLKAVDVFKFPPEKAYKYADSVARRTQVGYRAYELPAIMRSDTGKLFLQFQSWTFNAMNHLIYDLKLGNIPNAIGNSISKIGHDKKALPFSKDNRPTDVQYRKFFLLVGSLYLVNELYKRFGLREPTSIMSAVPRASFPAGRVISDAAKATNADNMIKALAGGQPSKHRPETIDKSRNRLLASVLAPFGGVQVSRFLEGTILPDNSRAKHHNVIKMYENAVRTKNKSLLADADKLANEQGVLIKDARAKALSNIRGEMTDLYARGIEKKDRGLIQQADKIANGNQSLIDSARKNALDRIKDKGKKANLLEKQRGEYYSHPHPGILDKAKETISQLVGANR